jgi:hypothetical protein
MKQVLCAMLLACALFTHAQSITFKDIKTMAKQPTSVNEKYLLDRSFSLHDIKFNLNDTLRDYEKISEFVKLGWTWTTKDGRTLREISYGTSNNESALYMLNEIQHMGFVYKSDNRNEEANGKFIYLEDYVYNLQIFIPDDKQNYCLITLTEK